MLGLGFDVEIDIKKVHIPFHFKQKNECVHCGAKGMLTFVDIFGRAANKEINAFDHIKCANCGRMYSIQWEPDFSKDPSKMYPSAVDPNVIKDFKNLISISNIRQKGEKNL